VWYLVQDPGDGALKHGVANDLEARVREHYLQGFTGLLAVRHYSGGSQAMWFESEVKAELKSLGAVPMRTRDDMPYGGHTETFHLSAIPLYSWLYDVVSPTPVREPEMGFVL
jgi:hypothetical protein